MLDEGGIGKYTSGLAHLTLIQLIAYDDARLSFKKKPHIC